MEWVLSQRTVPRRLLLLPVITFLLAVSLLTARSSRAAVGGPVAVLGIDAEDQSGGGHGPISTYISLTNSMLSKVLNGGTGILVIGGGKDPLDDVTDFWNQIGAAIPSQPITFANDASTPGTIAGQSFSGFALIVVVSTDQETPSGGLTADENTALVGRAADVAAFVDAGGGLLGFTQSGQDNPYLYLGGIGGFVATTGLTYSNITPTAEGMAVGITDALDVCCWHDEFTSYPSFLMPLATNATSGKVVALGGSRITFDTTTSTSETSTSSTSTSSTSTSVPASTTSTSPPASTTSTLPLGSTTSTTRALSTTSTTRATSTSTTAAPGTLISTPSGTSTTVARAPRLTG